MEAGGGGWHLLSFTGCIVFGFSMDRFCVVGLRFLIKLLAGKSIALCFSLENKHRDIEGGRFFLSNNCIVEAEQTKLCYLLTFDIMWSNLSNLDLFRILLNFLGSYWVISWLPYFHEYQLLFYFPKLKICRLKI